MAGAVTAALFLQRFVPEGTPWAHFDTFAWRPAAKPGRPKGGDALGLRAAFAPAPAALSADGLHATGLSRDFSALFARSHATIRRLPG